MVAATRSKRAMEAKKEKELVKVKKDGSKGEVGSAPNKYVSLAGKTHVLFLLLTLVPFALQALDLLPEDSQVSEVRSILSFLFIFPDSLVDRSIKILSLSRRERQRHILTVIFSFFLFFFFRSLLLRYF